MHEVEQRLKQEQDETGEEISLSQIDSKLRQLAIYPKYNGEKADIFSCGATFFMIQMRSPPFRKAV